MTPSLLIYLSFSKMSFFHCFLFFFLLPPVTISLFMHFSLLARLKIGCLYTLLKGCDLIKIIVLNIKLNCIWWWGFTSERSRNCAVPIYYHYAKIHLVPEWLSSHLNLKKNLRFSWYVFTHLQVKVKLATFRLPFQELRQRGVKEGVTAFPGLLYFALNTYLIMLRAKQRCNRQPFWVFGMTRPGIKH